MVLHYYIDDMPDPEEYRNDPTPGPAYSRYKEHPGYGERKRKTVDRSKIKAARKANVKRRSR